MTTGKMSRDCTDVPVGKNEALIGTTMGKFRCVSCDRVEDAYNGERRCEETSGLHLGSVPLECRDAQSQQRERMRA